jgi:hypothetical protein
MLRPPEEWWQNTPFCGHVWFTDHVPMDVTVRASEDYPVIFQARGLLPPPPRPVALPTHSPAVRANPDAACYHTCSENEHVCNLSGQQPRHLARARRQRVVIREKCARAPIHPISTLL